MLFRSDIQDMKTSAKHAALAYHDVQLAYLSGHMPADRHLAFHVALSSVNMAECAGNEIDCEQMARIYATAAIQLRRDHSNLPVVSVSMWLVVVVSSNIELSLFSICYCLG